MKKLIFAFALFLTVSAGCFAQDSLATARTPRTPEERAEAQTKHLTRTLALTAEQQPQVRAILLARGQKRDALRGTKPAVKGDKMRQAKSVKEETDAEMKKVLTETQFQQYAQQQEKKMEKMREKKMQRKGQY